MDSKLLRTFVAVANHGSFTGAAKELYIAQSAVSKHINQLERELGAQLFLRDTRMVRLTAAGEGFYRDSVDILRRMDAARTALAVEQDNYAVDQLKYEQGTISENTLLTAKDDLDTAQDTVNTAQRNLFSAYNNYRWAVDYGILN